MLTQLIIWYMIAACATTLLVRIYGANSRYSILAGILWPLYWLAVIITVRYRITGK